MQNNKTRLTEKNVNMQVPQKRITKKDRICRKIIEYGILGLIIWSPLPAGSINEWSILIIELVVLIMLAAYVLMTNKPHLPENLLKAWINLPP